MNASKHNYTKSSEFCNKVTGMTYALIASLIFTFNGILLQYFELQANNVVAIRSIIQIVAVGAVLKGKSKPLWITNVDDKHNISTIRLLLMTQAISSCMTLVCTYSAVLNMPFGDAMTIIFSSPVSTIILSNIFLKETCGVYRFACAILLMNGIILVVQPPLIFNFFLKHTDNSFDLVVIDKQYLYGALMAFTASVSFAITSVAVKKLYANKTTNSATLLTFYAGLGGWLVIFNVIYVEMNQHQSLTSISTSKGILSCCVAVQGLLAQYIRNLSIKRIEPVLVNFLSSFEILVAYIAQIIIFNTMPNILATVGSMVVILSVFAVTFEKILLQNFRLII